MGALSVEPAWMWEGQRAFRNLAQADARELLTALDPQLDPTLALIGLRWEDRDDIPAATIEPARFAHVLEPVVAVRTADPTADAGSHDPRTLGDPRLAAAQLGQSDHVALRNAVESALGPFEGGRETVARCSLPHRVGAYLVFVVVQLERAAFAAHGAAAGTGADSHGSESLVDAVVEEFLVAAAAALARPDRGRFGVLENETSDLMRAAGRRLMLAPGRHMHGMLDLYDVCNVISTMRYEGAEGSGVMLVAPRDTPGVQLELALAQPSSVRDFRKARKLLEVTGGGLLLLCSDGEIYGFGAAAEAPSGPPAALYAIAFASHHRWQLLRGGSVIMEVTYGMPHLPKPRIHLRDFRSRVEQTFPSMDDADVATLWSLVSAATEQRHGTMVVVTEGAEPEVQRLGGQATPVRPAPLTPALMRSITAIDGAVLLDTANRCHAIGVILDGMATDAGDPARGARYNSAVRYAASSPHACLAIIVSEDGMIDVVTSAG